MIPIRATCPLRADSEYSAGWAEITVRRVTPLKIAQIEPMAIVEPGGRSYIVLRTATDEGLTGYGEAPANHDPQEVVARLSKELTPLRGQDPGRLLRLDQLLRESGASHAARAAFNVSLLDILGKSVRAPLYEVLGGPTRNKARAMAVVEGASTGALSEAVRRAKQVGHRAFSIPLHMPSGRERGRAFYTDIRQMMDSLRETAGEECDFVLDCAGRTTPGEALSICDRMEDFHLLWLDEPFGDLNAAAEAGLSRRTSTPVGLGRTYTENSRFQDLLREGAVDVLRPDLSLNGITRIKQAAALAETYYIDVAPFHRGGPIGTLAGIHIAAALANSFIQETPFSLNEADRRMRRDLVGGWDETPEEGFFKLPEGPGLGVEVDDAALAEYRTHRERVGG